MTATPVSPLLRPPDAAAFVATAERLTNSHDAVGTAAVYAPDATLELVTDGAVELHRGVHEIAAAWSAVLGAGAKQGFTVRKSVVAADADTIVNRWEGTFGSHRRCRGIESWRFGDDGLVVEHRAETFLTVRSADELRAKLRLLLGAPRVTIALARARRG
ncbi:nuclear transport factor 2 family protein [Mycobacterium sp. NPDC003323]